MTRIIKFHSNVQNYNIKTQKQYLFEYDSKKLTFTFFSIENY